MARFPNIPAHPQGPEFDVLNHPRYTATFGNGISAESGANGLAAAARDIGSSPGFWLGKITGLGTNADEYEATQVLPDGTAPTGALTWDGEVDNLPVLHLLAGGCGPAINKIVRIYHGFDSAGAAYWWFENDQPFPIDITGNASLATNRWKYAFSERTFTADLTATLTGGRTGTTSSGYATNLAEMYHTATYAWGADVTIEPYLSSTFQPLPVGGGGTATTHRYSAPVWCYEIVDTAGALKRYFWAMGSSDGNCS